MITGVFQFAVVVRDYDEAIAFYRDVLGFALLEDTDMGGGKRWVRVGAKSGAVILLARGVNEQQASRIGNQTGGRVFIFLETDDCRGDFARMLAAGVQFRGEPREEPYGTVVVFQDLYGNLFDLIQRRS
ncbi:MAG TPA: VOC family protein [Phycisphaerales bacterium]|nr:VOC family protein [Phycisphaerales bacterium]